jgi:hypothetical protein
MRRLFTATILIVISCLCAAAMAGAGQRQVGAWGYSPGNLYAGANQVRTTISPPPLPQTTYDGAGVSYVYLWIGQYLPDGSFYQAGFVTQHRECPGQLRWFVWGFNPAGDTTVNTFGPCGLTGTNSFTLRYEASQPNGTYSWLANMGGNTLPGSRFYARSNNIGTELPYATSETSRLTSALPNVNNQMGPVTYNPALQVRLGGVWQSVEHAVSYYWNAPCPPHNIYSLVFNRIRSGAPLSTISCTPDNNYLY